MARVTVTVTARDLTGPQLSRMRRNFSSLGQDMDRLLTNRTRQNFNRLSQSITTARRDLVNLRGAIPDDEFFRLDRAIRSAQHQMRRGFNRTSEQQLQRIANQVRRVTDGFQDLDRTGQIRVRVDMAALRRADARLAAWRREQQRAATRGINVVLRADRRLTAGLAARGRGVRVPVTPDVDRNRFRRTLLSALTAPLRIVGRLITGTLSDGIGQGVADAGKTAGPALGAILVAAIAAALAVVGAALSGILVTVLGAAFVGIGGVSAAMSDQVKDRWSKALKSLKKDFAEVGEPMIPVLNRAIGKIEDMANRATPQLKKAIEDTVPATNGFIDGLLKGFESFGKAAFKPIMDAWNVFAPVFGQEWNEFMDELGNSFGRMADLVREHPTEIAAALDVVFEAVDLLVDTITFFGKVWVFTMQNAGDAIGGVLQALSYLSDAVLGMLGGIIDGAAAAFGWVPSLGPKLKAAAGAFDEFKSSVSGKLQDLANKAFGWDDALNKANRKRTLEADIASWSAQLAKARADLKKTSSQKAKAKLEADISDLNAKLKAARGELASLNGRTATTYVNTVFSYSGKNAALDRGAFAHGGVRGLSAAATGGVRNNMTLVGEQGPELINLAPGSHVRSNPDSRRMTAGAGGNNVPIQINVQIDGKTAARALFDPLRGEVRDRGGNVQDALGQRGRGN